MQWPSPLLINKDFFLHLSLTEILFLLFVFPYESTCEAMEPRQTQQEHFSPSCALIFDAAIE